MPYICVCVCVTYCATWGLFWRSLTRISVLVPNISQGVRRSVPVQAGSWTPRRSGYVSSWLYLKVRARNTVAEFPACLWMRSYFATCEEGANHLQHGKKQKITPATVQIDTQLLCTRIIWISVRVIFVKTHLKVAKTHHVLMLYFIQFSLVWLYWIKKLSCSSLQTITLMYRAVKKYLLPIWWFHLLWENICSNQPGSKWKYNLPCL